MLNIKKAAMAAITLVTVLLSVGAVYAESFIVQPTGEMTVADESYTITWQTDFEPFVVAVYKVGEDEPVLHDITGAATSCEVPSASAEYFVRAWYDDGNAYVDSNTAAFVQRGFTVQPEEGEVYYAYGGESIDVPFELNFSDGVAGVYPVTDGETGFGDYKNKGSVPYTASDSPRQIGVKYNVGFSSHTMLSNTFYVKQGAAYTTQPKSAVVGIDEKANVTWDVNFAPSSNIKIYGGDYGSNYRTLDKDVRSYELPASDEPYYIVMYYYLYPTNYEVVSNTFYVTENDKRAFTSHPQGGNVTGGEKLTVTWNANFVPATNPQVYRGGTKYTTLDASQIKAAGSCELPASPYPYTVRLPYYYTENAKQYMGWVESDPFYVNQIAAFTTQPKSGVTTGGEKLTVSWETNFKPSTNIRIYQNDKYITLDSGHIASSVSYEFDAGEDPYIIKVPYTVENVTYWVESDPFYVTQNAAILTDFTGFSAPGGEILNLKYDLNFTAKEVLLWKGDIYQRLGTDVSSGTFYVKADDDTPYRLTATYVSGNKTYTVESDPFYVKQTAAFSVQPKDITVYGVSKGKASFDTNFTPSSLFLIHGETSLALANDCEQIIAASDTPYKIRAYYQNGFYSFPAVTGYIDSEEFYVRQGSAFIAQPKDGATEAGSKFIVPFKLNFTPVNIIVNRGNIYAYAALEPDAEFYEAEISEEPYYIIASYDGGSVTSEPFYISVRQKGDVNADGKQDEEDAAVLMKHLTDIIKLDNRSLEYAKTDGSEQTVNMLDVIAMLKLADEHRE